MNRAPGKLIDARKAVPVLLIMMLISSASGCFGGSAPPTLKEELSSLDAALAKYDVAKNNYSSGNYENAKQEFIACVNTFKDCQSAFDRIAGGDITPIEKKCAVSLAGGCKQYAYAAAYMRDSCSEALKPSSEHVYLMKVSADECEQTARLNCESAREDLQRFWKGQ